MRIQNSTDLPQATQVRCRRIKDLCRASSLVRDKVLGSSSRISERREERDEQRQRDSLKQSLSEPPNPFVPFHRFLKPAFALNNLHKTKRRNAVGGVGRVKEFGQKAPRWFRRDSTVAHSLLPRICFVGYTSSVLIFRDNYRFRDKYQITLRQLWLRLLRSRSLFPACAWRAS